MKTANEALRFLLELCMLAAYADWGFETGDGTGMKIVLGIGAPLLAATVWGLFVAPKALVKITDPWRLLVEIIVFGAASLALLAAGHAVLAAILALAYAVNRVLLYIWKQQARRKG